MSIPARRQARFQDRYGPWAVVTGATSGIGLAIAQQLAQAGLHLVLVARQEARLTELARELSRQSGVDVRGLPVDLAEPNAVEAIISATATLDVGLLVAAAGFGTSGPFLDSPWQTEQPMAVVNCVALAGLTWHFGRRLRSRGRGGVILLSSIVGLQGVPYAAHYAATKAYVQSLGEGLAREWAGTGVDLLTSAPGPTHTGFADRAGLRLGAAMSADAVASATLAALGRRSTLLPGALSKLLVYSQAFLPRWARVRLMGQIMQGMVRERSPRDTSPSKLA